jgi:hypothetical protein
VAANKQSFRYRAPANVDSLSYPLALCAPMKGECVLRARIGDSSFATNRLDRLTSFSPHWTALNGSELGGGHFSRCVLRLFRTRILKINSAGETGKERT